MENNKNRNYGQQGRNSQDEKSQNLGSRHEGHDFQNQDRNAGFGRAAGHDENSEWEDTDSYGVTDRNMAMGENENRNTRNSSDDSDAALGDTSYNASDISSDEASNRKKGWDESDL
jgi:hypothetical protein